ncbi:MAG: hypothetical protein M9886_06895 [Candidatus Nanopelagicales bacterium]|nr:hypothetical protein [Candidatus Nanopelagicales bacterium]
MSGLGLPENRLAVWWLHGFLTAAGPTRVATVRWAARRLGKRAGLGQNHVTAAARDLGLRRSVDAERHAWWTLPGGHL